MLTICWAAKGGNGASVTSASMAFASTAPSVLVDLAGDQPTIMGIGELDTPGVGDWLTSGAAPDRLTALEIPLTTEHTMIHQGTSSTIVPQRWPEAAAYWNEQPRHVIVDAGTVPDRALLDVPDTRRLLVTRPCYLSVRAAARCGLPLDGVILINEPGRSLRAADIEAALGAPVIATVLADPAVARAVDAGLLSGRLPSSNRRQLRDAAA